MNNSITFPYEWNIGIAGPGEENLAYKSNTLGFDEETTLDVEVVRVENKYNLCI